MAFRNKGHLIQMEQPDILIVPECEPRYRKQFSLFRCRAVANAQVLFLKFK